jgi:hypothetical protein
MELRDAFEASIGNFLSGKYPEELASLSEGGLKYTPEYFNMMEEEILSGKKPKGKKKKEETEDGE